MDSRPVVLIPEDERAASRLVTRRPAPHAHARPDPVPIGDSERHVRDVLPALLRQAPVGVGVIRRDRTIAYLNAEFRRLLGIRATEQGVRLAPLHRMDGSPFSPREEPLAHLWRTGRPVEHQRVLLRRENGSHMEVSLTMTPIVDGSGRVVSAIMYVEDPAAHDVDPSLREAFVGVLSHEFRTPITSIYGGTQLLLGDRMPGDVRASVIGDIAAEAEQLQRLVEDLLAIARVERGVAEIGSDPILVQRLAAEAARAEERRWPGRRVKVEAPRDLPAARADGVLSMQILRNLISDAVRYSPANEPVLVRLEADDAVVRVSVLDRGRGFRSRADADADPLRPFSRSASVAPRVPGMGIGLYVARTLAEAQGGGIWFRDRPDGGAEVGFTLPRYRDDVAT